MTSSCLCKNTEGAGFPFQAEALEDGLNDAVHAMHVDKAHHGTSAAAHLHKAALDDIGGAQLPPYLSGNAEESQQLRQIGLQLAHDVGIVLAPPPGERVSRGLGRRSAGGSSLLRLPVPVDLGQLLG